MELTAGILDGNGGQTRRHRHIQLSLEQLQPSEERFIKLNQGVRIDGDRSCLALSPNKTKCGAQGYVVTRSCAGGERGVKS